MKTYDALADTIVAPATPAGGALAIVRLAGEQAREIAARLAPSTRPRASHKLYRARVLDSVSEVIDEAMIVEMHAPRSYTGDDVVELHLHGARLVVDQVIAQSLALGARLAEPGEFTLRAFLNGRMDLSQAEAVADLIAAKNEAQRRVATRQLGGSLSAVVSELLDEVLSVLAALCASFDFPEQVGEWGLRDQDRAALAAVLARLDTLVAHARLSLGARRHVVLAGAPNTGKSSLLNALVGEKRALVDAEAGTTRDLIEVELALGGELLSLWDTAGLRKDAAGVEREGIELGRARALWADVLVWLVAPESCVWPEGELSAKAAVVVSKADLLDEASRARLAAEVEARCSRFLGFVSSRTREGLEDLTRALAVSPEDFAEHEVVVVRERHLCALRGAHAAINAALAHGDRGVDLQVTELERAARKLGAILGREVEIEVLDKIFSEFCLGK